MIGTALAAARARDDCGPCVAEVQVLEEEKRSLLIRVQQLTDALNRCADDAAQSRPDTPELLQRRSSAGAPGDAAETALASDSTGVARPGALCACSDFFLSVPIGLSAGTLIADRGTRACPGGYDRISSMAECMDAAAQLDSNGVPFFGSTSNQMQRYPAGCFAWSTTGTSKPYGVWYNPDAIGSSQEDSSPICKAAGVARAAPQMCCDVGGSEHRRVPSQVRK